MRVENSAARQFYETEAAQSNWSRRDLGRQIGSSFYERLFASTDKTAMLEGARQKTNTDQRKNTLIASLLYLQKISISHQIRIPK